jgi:hypothetical protein
MDSTQNTWSRTKHWRLHGTSAREPQCRRSLHGIMNNYGDIVKSLAWRVPLAAPFFYVCITGCAFVFSPFFGVVGAIIVAFPFARLIAEPAGKLFYPGQRFSRPQPAYSIPESKRAKGLYKEAIAGFERIAEEHPSEVKPYIEMIDISIVNLKDPESAKQIYQRGISVLKNDKDKEVLATMYSAIRTRLNAKPSN